MVLVVVLFAYGMHSPLSIACSAVCVVIILTTCRQLCAQAAEYDIEKLIHSNVCGCTLPCCFKPSCMPLMCTSTTPEASGSYVAMITVGCLDCPLAACSAGLQTPGILGPYSRPFDATTKRLVITNHFLTACVSLVLQVVPFYCWSLC
eukprot:GHRR01030160.1.p1 GENE.GHRR01030160.1~~GHRR01030160.1.p1  ORF type:complete len:148 (+),score=15.14 GHRR01030160.1:176-619(+)